MKLTRLIFFLILFSSLDACSPEKEKMTDLEKNEQVMPGKGLVKLVEVVRPGFLFGAFADGLNSPDKDRLRAIFSKEFGIMTIGVYMGTTQRIQGSYNFVNVDDLVRFCQIYGIVIHMHPLIGGYQYCPDWLNSGTFTVEELRQIMRDRITTILTRYNNQTRYIDVVNEAITGMDASGNIKWLTTGHPWIKMGWHDDADGKWPLYLEEAFRIAREVGGPSYKLIYNDNTNAMMNSSKALATLKLVNDFKKAGIPIDGIGIQFHCSVVNGVLREGSGGGGLKLDYDSFAANMKRFADAGIEIHITEFDVHLPQNPVSVDYDMQATAYREVLKRCLEEPACKSFTSWGFTDKYAWRPYTYNSHQLIYDEYFNQKKAYSEIRKMLEEKILASQH